MDSSVTMNFLKKKPATCKIMPFLIPMQQSIPWHEKTNTAVPFSILIKIKDRSETTFMQGLSCFIFILYLLRVARLKAVCCFEKYCSVSGPTHRTFSFHILQLCFHSIYIYITVLFSKINETKAQCASFVIGNKV
jgi:hypothetical protein